MQRILSLHVSSSARILQALRARAATAQLQPRASTTQSWQIPAASRIPSRWSSSALYSRVLHPRYGYPLPRSPLSTSYIRRPFSSGASFNSRQRHTYNRFGGGGGGRQSLFFTAVQQARPIHFVGIGLGVSVIYLYNTETVDVTGRRRFNIVSYEQELRMGEQTYREILQAERGKVLPDSHPLTQTVDRVLQRLIPHSGLEGIDWKVHVIKDDRNANAFVIPGGKVFVYTGMLPICKDEDGIAAVLGHEIAHTVAHHSAERMSNHFLTMGAAVLMAMLFDVSGHLSSVLMNFMWSLPNSRTQESEADHIGLMMMAKACYDPQAAARIWAVMQKQEKVAPPQFMSTHPSSYNREEAIKGLLEKAEHVSAENGCGDFGGYVPGFYSAFGSMR